MLTNVAGQAVHALIIRHHNL